MKRLWWRILLTSPLLASACSQTSLNKLDLSGSGATLKVFLRGEEIKAGDSTTALRADGSVVPDQLDFGTVYPNMGDAFWEFEVENYSTASDTILFVVDNTQDFSIEGGDGLRVAAQSRASVKLNFNLNAAPGLHQAKLRIQHGQDILGPFTVSANLAAPLPANQILNPFYKQPIWTSWYGVTSPVTDVVPGTTNSYTLNPVDTSVRLFPESLSIVFPGKFLNWIANPANAVSGMWDDLYMSRDSSHSCLSGSFNGANGNVSPALQTQFVGLCPAQMVYDKIFARPEFQPNFTSESITGQGYDAITMTWRFAFKEAAAFRSLAQSSPAVVGMKEEFPEKVVDSYDALYGSTINSFGHSWSELEGIKKMLICSSVLPRPTKELLKKHGHFGLAMIQAFKRSLPFTDVDNAPLDSVSEVLWRPVYQTNPDLDFGGINYNIYFHKYNNTRHLYEMVEWCKRLTVAPPVVIFDLKSFKNVRAGTVVQDVQQKSDANGIIPWPSGQGFDYRSYSAYGYPIPGVMEPSGKQLLRFHVARDETWTVRVDLSKSIDLQNRPLTYRLKVVHPNHERLVSIKHLGGTLFEIEVHFDPAMPAGRVPIAVEADNGAEKSLPAFINFYLKPDGFTQLPQFSYFYPGATGNCSVYGATGCSYYTLPDAKYEVTRNLRPQFGSLPAAPINVNAGGHVAFELPCTDPEGFSTHLYQWKGQPGHLSNTGFEWDVPADQASGDVPLRFVCSDGTGGFNSTQVLVHVN